MALTRWTSWLAVAGGLAMMAAALVVVVSVSLRSLAGGQVSGDFEIVQVATAIAAFAFLPFCQLRGGNILVDSFTARWPAWIQRSLDGLWDMVYAGMAATIAFELARGAYDSISSNTVSMVLGLPYGWAIALGSAMTVLLAVTAFVTALRRFRGTP